MLISGMGVLSSAAKRSSRGSRGGRMDPNALDRAEDLKRMRAIAAFTARSMRTRSPRPFGAAIVHTESGKTLLRALNAVRQEIDPSAHAEVRAIRLAAKKLRKVSLAGYSLYSTCEPCPMCMSAALWAGVDRVVYGASIQDANLHCQQIRIPAREVVARGDMACVVDGPLAREACTALFTHPRMLRAFRSWATSKPGRKPTPKAAHK
jgi:tRNA(Arg) A34 adenosine deaminase TadA